MIEYSNPSTVAAPDGHFTQAVLAPANARMLFISGQVPRNVAGETVGVGDIDAQTEQVFKNLHEILKAHCATFSNVVKATLFITDFSRADGVARIRERYYGSAKPASTWVEVSALGDPEWMLEVELIAVVP
jgi:2-iminobutanoate/2-iminopropanoate deaminase